MLEPKQSSLDYKIDLFNQKLGRQKKKPKLCIIPKRQCAFRTEKAIVYQIFILSVKQLYQRVGSKRDNQSSVYKIYNVL